jgi:hypothetical protein
MLGSYVRNRYGRTATSEFWQLTALRAMCWIASRAEEELVMAAASRTSAPNGIWALII